MLRADPNKAGFLGALKIEPISAFADSKIARGIRFLSTK